MEYEDRLVDPGGQICHTMDLQGFAASLWWQVEAHVEKRRLCIP
jgi:hypothetical protein